jgi:hypothetical protein
VLEGWRRGHRRALLHRDRNDVYHRTAWGGLAVDVRAIWDVRKRLAAGLIAIAILRESAGRLRAAFFDSDETAQYTVNHQQR